MRLTLCKISLAAHTVGSDFIRSFHSIHNVVDRGVLHMRCGRNLRAKLDTVIKSLSANHAYLKTLYAGWTNFDSEYMQKQKYFSTRLLSLASHAAYRSCGCCRGWRAKHGTVCLLKHTLFTRPYMFYVRLV